LQYSFSDSSVIVFGFGKYKKIGLFGFIGVWRLAQAGHKWEGVQKNGGGTRENFPNP